MRFDEIYSYKFDIVPSDGAWHKTPSEIADILSKNFPRGIERKRRAMGNTIGKIQDGKRIAVPIVVPAEPFYLDVILSQEDWKHHMTQAVLGPGQKERA